MVLKIRIPRVREEDMGLDMYLYRYITPKGRVIVDGRELIDVTQIRQEIAYWRKANAIHKWFVDNIQGGCDDCEVYIVSKSKLIQELYSIVKEVLNNKERAKELLPTTGGFFFGSTEYDGMYFEDLKYTKGVLEEILQDGEDCNYYYYSSW